MTILFISAEIEYSFKLFEKYLTVVILFLWPSKDLINLLLFNNIISILCVILLGDIKYGLLSLIERYTSKRSLISFVLIISCCNFKFGFFLNNCLL